MMEDGTRRTRGAQAPRIVLPYPRRPAQSAHEMASQDCLAAKIAALLGYEFMTAHQYAELEPVGAPYCIPCDTLIDSERASDPVLSGLRDEEDLFGGVVPHAFIGTKAITHSLVDLSAQRPTGWSVDFGEQVRAAVLRGATVFSADDARRAGGALLREGPIRAKSVNGIGGRGQRVVEDHAALDLAIQEYDRTSLAACGLVLEEHLEDVCTYSVGRVRVGELVSTYVGTQSLTDDNSGAPVYGGSELRLVRGDFEALLASQLTEDEREAVRLALIYDRAALNCYRGLVASRRNYDIARGTDASGVTRFGVLEQSWRAGGASMAEAYALEAFQQHPELQSLRAFTWERYGERHAPPPVGRLIYEGDDAQGGLITKYAGISSYDDK